jgi:hypothetical protein
VGLGTKFDLDPKMPRKNVFQWTRSLTPDKQTSTIGRMIKLSERIHNLKALIFQRKDLIMYIIAFPRAVEREAGAGWHNLPYMESM